MARRDNVLIELTGKKVGVVLANGQMIGGTVKDVSGGVISFEQRGKRCWAMIEHVIAWEQMDDEATPNLSL